MKLDESAFYPLLKTSESGHQNHIFFKPLSNSVTDLPIRSCTWLNPYILEINFLPIRSAQIRADGALVILYLSHYC